jgi:hypothetical protein
MYSRMHMQRRSFVSLLAASSATSLPLAGASSPLDNLAPSHPRLLLTDEDLSRVAAVVNDDKRAQGMLFHLRSRGEELLRTPPVEYKLIGPRLLAQSRACVERAYVFSTLYLLERDTRWADGLMRNIRAAARFPDWNPSHFLDTAEMTHAFAIAYDWMHMTLNPEDKRMIRNAIVEKGLRQGIATGYRRGPDGKPGAWALSRHNWNQVCNGGMVMGALAIAEEEPQLAREIVDAALTSLPLAMNSFAPDGGWAEGVGYWMYTLRYTVPLLAAFETALGRRFGIEDAPGFSSTGDFYLHGVSPRGIFFNFADCSRRSDHGFPWLHWMARRFDHPVWHWAATTRATGEHPLSLLWYEPSVPSPAAARVPLDRVFTGICAAMMRSAWDDPMASYVGFYAGHNGTNHSHLEMGTFVFDALGERWVEELGTDDYDLPGYFGQQRWNYYRLNSHGQNVMLFGDKNQQVPARGRITSTGGDKNSSHAIADLTEGYQEIAASVRRGVRLMDERRVLLVQDEFRLKEPAVYQWQIHTMAQVDIDVDRARLSLNDKTVEVRALSRTPVEFRLEKASAGVLAGGAGKMENANQEYRKLVVRTRRPVGQGTIAVVLHPLANPSAPRGANFVRPLDAWD